MASVTRFRQTTITIEGQPVPIQIRRATVREGDAFRTRLWAFVSDSNKAITDDDEAWIRESFDRVSLRPGALDMDGQPILTGAQLLEVIGEDGMQLKATLLAIANIAIVSDDEGKASASGSASVPSSGAHDPAPVGPTLAATADAAALAVTTATEAVTAETATPLSGEMAISN